MPPALCAIELQLLTFCNAGRLSRMLPAVSHLQIPPVHIANLHYAARPFPPRFMPQIVNIAAYKFATLTDIRELRANLLPRCKAWELKGTILLSPEGINLFVAGATGGIESLLTALRAIPGLDGLEPKYSETDHQPFRRMLVRLKKEIITFGVEGINPALRTSPKLKARELKQWLDEGRPVTLLDTRNDYEVKLGTFRNALPAGIDTFKQFPHAVRKLPAEMKEQPVVMFCTGGIRCEKAGPFMEREGFKNVLQLEGGILKYFEECGGAHYDGECFVFDQRVGVDPAPSCSLLPTVYKSSKGSGHKPVCPAAI